MKSYLVNLSLRGDNSFFRTTEEEKEMNEHEHWKDAIEQEENGSFKFLIKIISWSVSPSAQDKR